MADRLAAAAVGPTMVEKFEEVKRDRVARG